MSTGCSGKVRLPVQAVGYFARGRKGTSRRLPHEESVSFRCKGLTHTVKLVMVEVVCEAKKQGKSSALYRSMMIKI